MELVKAICWIFLQLTTFQRLAHNRFFCPFSILITLLGEEGAGLCAYRAFVCYLCTHYTIICITFSLPPGVGGWMRLLLVALHGLFYLPFWPVIFFTEQL